MTDVLLDRGPSHHEVLFFYNGNNQPPAAARSGAWKIHWRTGKRHNIASNLCLGCILSGGLSAGPGLGGCNNDWQPRANCTEITHNPPLLFDVDVDPSEAFPLTASVRDQTNFGRCPVFSKTSAEQQA